MVVSYRVHLHAVLDSSAALLPTYRLRRNTTSDAEFHRDAAALSRKFAQRGYGRKKVSRWAGTVLPRERESVLRDTPKESDNIPNFITQYTKFCGMARDTGQPRYDNRRRLRFVIRLSEYFENQHKRRPFCPTPHPGNCDVRGPKNAPPTTTKTGTLDN